MRGRSAATLAVSIGLGACNAILGAGDYTIDPGVGGEAAGAGGSGTGTGGDGQGGSDPALCMAPVSSKQTITIEGDITGDQTLRCDFNYQLLGNVFVRAPAVLTIQPGTTVLGDKSSLSALVVQMGAKLVADGTPDMPIVFTSAGGEFSDPGDWGGVVLLGRAPINQPTPAQVEGLLDGGLYGGTDPEDDSGSLRYVRIEYSGKELGPNNELNGLTLAGVGRSTTIDHVMVRKTTDDCFEFFGGTVDAKHLLCQEPGDDGFDWDNGYTGRLQFVVVQQGASYPGAGDMNGFEGDNDAAGDTATPLSSPTVYNATLCGRDYATGQQYGLLARKATRGTIRNAVFLGFEAAVDVRDAVGPTFTLESSTFFANTQLAYPEDAAPPYEDDDAMFDEEAWLAVAPANNTFADPGIPGCTNAAALMLAPGEVLDGAAPPDDGFFDTRAAFRGAFRDASDTWATGTWVRWSED